MTASRHWLTVTRRCRTAVLAAAWAVVLTGCGGGEHQGAHTGSGDNRSFSFGRPGEAAKASRTIEVRLLDSLRFEPASVDAKAGETVTFRLVNTGRMPHEFVLGEEKEQAEHEAEMQEMAESGHKMGDHPNGINVDPGQTREFTWTFSEPTSVIYGCHQPGHYAGGMKGTVAVA